MTINPIDALIALNGDTKSKAEKLLIGGVSEYINTYSWHPNQDVPANILDEYDCILTATDGYINSHSAYSLQIENGKLAYYGDRIDYWMPALTVPNLPKTEKEAE